jgi:hypothetical protein
MQPLCHLQTEHVILPCIFFVHPCHAPPQNKFIVINPLPVIKAVDPIKIVTTSMSNTSKVFDNLHMMWMCIWMCLHLIMVTLVDQAFVSYTVVHCHSHR